MNNNKRWLFKIADKLGLSEEFNSSIEKMLEIIDEKGYKIIIQRSFLDKNGKVHNAISFHHYRDCQCIPNKKIIYINPDIQECLNDDNTNFIWGFLHEIGHILTVGIGAGKTEIREVIAWEMAQNLIRSKFPELKVYQDSFEKRAIYSLKHYWDKYSWDNTYEWHTNEYEERILKRIPNSKTSRN